DSIHNVLGRDLGNKQRNSILDSMHTVSARRVTGLGEETRLEIDRWRNELKDNFATRQDAVDLQTKLVKRVSRVEGTIILWAFVFWFTLILAMYIIFKFIQ